MEIDRTVLGKGWTVECREVLHLTNASDVCVGSPGDVSAAPAAASALAGPSFEVRSLFRASGPVLTAVLDDFVDISSRMSASRMGLGASNIGWAAGTRA